MINSIKKNTCTLVILTVTVVTICIYYVYLYTKTSIPIELKNFYLTLAYPTDPIYFKLMESLNNLDQIPEGFNHILYFFEIIIYKTLGFEYLWITAPIFKAIFIVSVLLILKQLYKLNVWQQIALVLFLFVFILTNETTFADRFSRPHITQIIVPFSYILFILYQRDKKNIYLFLSVFLVTLLILSDPWLVAYFVFFYSFYFIFKRKFRKNLIILISFILGLIPIFIFKSISSTDFNSLLHLEYLGFKEVYSLKQFILDYYRALRWIDGFRSLFIIILLLLLSLKNKTFYKFICIISTIVFGWVPYAIVDFCIQPYHVINAIKPFLNYIIIFEVGLMISNLKIKLLKKQTQYIILIMLILMVNIDSKKEFIFYRANQIYKNYHHVFNEIDNIDPNLEIVSNDHNARSYTLAFTDNSLSVPEGFYHPIDLELSITKINRTMSFLKENYDFKNKQEYIKCKEKFLRFATHNYFSISKSCISPSLKDNIDDFDQDKFAFTFNPWNMVYPKSFHTDNEYLSDKITSALVILKNDDLNGSPIVFKKIIR